MSRTFEGTLVGDRIRFHGAAPQEPGPLSVRITVLGAAGSAPDGNAARGAAMGAALEELSRGGALTGVTDPAEWQREVRRDRDLPGRVLPPPTPDAP
jgi:hypothetical protein